MLCQKCSNIHFRALEDCDVIQSDPTRLDNLSDSDHTYDRLFYFHHDSREALEASAATGCHFCEMLHRNMFQERQDSRSAELSFSRGELILRRSVAKKWLSKEDGIRDWNANDWIFVHCGNRTLTTTSLQGFEGMIRLSKYHLTDRVLIGEIGKMLEALTMSPILGTQREVPALTEPSGLLCCEDLRADSSALLADKAPELYSPWLDCSTLSPASMALAAFG